MNPDAEDLCERIMIDFWSAIDECVEKGAPKRMTIGIGDKDITVDIYLQKEDMKKFNDLVGKAVTDAIKKEQS